MDDGELHAYLDGAGDAFGPGELEQVEHHLAACADCRARLEAEREIRARAGALMDFGAPAGAQSAPPFEELQRAHGPPATRRRARGWLVLPWAASLVLALGVGWLARQNAAPEHVAITLDRAEAESMAVATTVTSGPEVDPPVPMVETTSRAAPSGVSAQAAAPRPSGATVAAGRAATAPTSLPRDETVRVEAAPSPARDVARQGVVEPREAPPPVPQETPAPTGPPAYAAAPARADEAPTVTAFDAGGVAADTAAAASVVIRGVVTETEGEPIAGATVRVNGSSIGTLTQRDGSYTLVVPRSLLEESEGERSLRVSILGYGSAERRLDVDTARADTQNFALRPEVVALEALVVPGYGARQRVYVNPIDTRAAERLLGGELPRVADLPVLGIARRSSDGETVVVLRQRLVGGEELELEILPPERRDRRERSADREGVEELSARATDTGAQLELRVRGMLVTATAPVSLAELREIVSTIR